MKSKNVTINKLKEIFKNFNNNFSLAQVGSSLKNDVYNDFDLIFITDKRNEGLNFLLNIFTDYNILINDDALKIYNFCDIEISIAIYTYMQIDNIVKNYISGEKVLCEHRSWALGYWIGEGFINDVRKCKIIYDNNNKLKNIKESLSKELIYSNQKILNDCKAEIKIKRSLLCKCNKDTLEYSLLKNDIILAMIRSSYILSGKILNSFNNMNNVISNIPLRYRKIINKYKEDSDDTCILKMLNEINMRIMRKNSLYLGTWQFDGNFNNLSDDEIVNLIKYAKNIGITKFDTALVYGNGKVEKLLSKVIDESDTILTKIPARIKPTNGINMPLKNYYDEDYINCCIEKSLYNLERKKIEIVLLHNWIEEWNNKPVLLDWLIALKKRKIVKKIGISLPNGYQGQLPKIVLNKIDVIEAPLNPDNQWILNSLNTYKENNIEVILRSLFMQGKLLNEDKDIYIDIIRKTNLLNTSMVIGMTTKEQMNMNINIIQNS